MVRVDEINKIKKDFLQNNISKNEIAKKFNRSWDTVNRLLNMNEEEIQENLKTVADIIN